MSVSRTEIEEWVGSLRPTRYGYWTLLGKSESYVIYCRTRTDVPAFVILKSGQGYFLNKPEQTRLMTDTETSAIRDRLTELAAAGIAPTQFEFGDDVYKVAPELERISLPRPPKNVEIEPDRLHTLAHLAGEIDRHTSSFSVQSGLQTESGRELVAIVAAFGRSLESIRRDLGIGRPPKVSADQGPSDSFSANAGLLPMIAQGVRTSVLALGLYEPEDRRPLFEFWLESVDRVTRTIQLVDQLKDRMRVYVGPDFDWANAQPTSENDQTLSRRLRTDKFYGVPIERGPTHFELTRMMHERHPTKTFAITDTGPLLMAEATHGDAYAVIKSTGAVFAIPAASRYFAASFRAAKTDAEARVAILSVEERRRPKRVGFLQNAVDPNPRITGLIRETLSTLSQFEHALAPAPDRAPTVSGSDRRHIAAMHLDRLARGLDALEAELEQTGPIDWALVSMMNEQPEADPTLDYGL